MPGRNLDEPPAIAAGALRGVVLGSATLELDRLVVRRDGEAIRLRPRSADVLGHLVAHAGRVVPKQELIDAVWKDTAVTDDSLVQCLVEIRRALGPEQARVRTVRGRGYVVDAVEPAVASPAAVEDHQPSPAAPPAAVGHRGSGRWAFAGVALATLLAVAGAVGAIRREPAPARVSPQETMNAEARLAHDEARQLLASSRSQVDLQRARQPPASTTATRPPTPRWPTCSSCSRRSASSARSTSCPRRASARATPWPSTRRWRAPGRRWRTSRRSGTGTGPRPSAAIAAPWRSIPRARST